MKSAGDEKWDIRFLRLADQIASWSKDPSRGVGAVIVSPARQIVATGFNGLPRGVEDRTDRLERPAKYELIVHAEMNAIIQCARNGVSPLGCAVFTTFSPCVACAIAMVQAGIARVVTWEPDLVGADAHWLESIKKAQAVLHESGVQYEVRARPAVESPSLR
ncbi:MAG: dCMP deaminase family protein [Planctomycetes bacterium]|nr:dCMP deaminase family protein [Planctomycetota bacterium]